MGLLEKYEKRTVCFILARMTTYICQYICNYKLVMSSDKCAQESCLLIKEVTKKYFYDPVKKICLAEQ
jgi:hypothetical protein